MPTSDTDAQDTIFWERLRRLFISESPDSDGQEQTRRSLVLTVCVVASSVLWLSLTLQEERTVSFSVPTRIINMPDGQALTDVPPATVQVKVSGEGRQLIWLYMNPPTMPIDAASSEVNVESALDLAQEAGVRIESVEPQQVDLMKEPRVERSVPVASRVDVDLPPTHELLSPLRLEPDSITVWGAESIVGSLTEWPTEPQTIRGLTDTLETSVALIDTLTQLVDRSTETVTLRAEAGKFVEATREIDVNVTGAPSDQNLVALEPSAIRVRYRVLFNQLFESQRASGFFATVAYNQIRTDTTGYVRPRIRTPPELVIRDPEPTPARLQYYTFVSNE